MADTKDYEELAKKLLILAEKGDSKSQYHLGVLYNDGKGVPKDYSQAASWYLKAAQQGHQKAQLYLGLLYQNGRGVERDQKQAAQWLQKSAEQGEQKAQYFLGVLYYKGVGVKKDFELASHWLEQSANQGNTEAQKLLDEILSISNIEPEDIEPYDEDDELNNQEPVKKSDSIFGAILGALLIIVIILSAIGGGYYYFFMRTPVPARNLPVESSQENYSVQPKQDTENNNDNSVAESKNIDVFSLAENGTLRQLRQALSTGAVFNQQHDDGETPLHRAASSNKDADAINFLIEQGLDVNSVWTTKTSFTPLLLSVNNGNVEAALELLRNNATPNYIDNDSCSILQHLIMIEDDIINSTDKRKIILSMIKNGADVNYHGESGISSSTALSLAVQNDDAEIAKILLDRGADPNLKDDSDNTAVDYANMLMKSSKIRKFGIFTEFQNNTDNVQTNAVQYEDNNDNRVSKVSKNSRASETQTQLDKLIRANKVPDYIRDSGRFSFNKKYKGGFVDISGTNVRLRSQPNTQARIIASGNEDMWLDGNIIEYLGEWTNSEGERWVLGDYQASNMNQPQAVWIYGKYTELVTEKGYEERISIEAGEY